MREEDESNIAHGWADTEDRYRDKKSNAPVQSSRKHFDVVSLIIGMLASFLLQQLWYLLLWLSV